MLAIAPTIFLLYEYYHYFSVTYCLAPPQLQNAIADTSNITSFAYGSEVVYKCRPGYHYTDNITEQTVRCSSSQTWEYQYDSCRGQFSKESKSFPLVY